MLSDPLPFGAVVALALLALVVWIGRRVAKPRKRH
jgi:hypothetical protein